MKEKRESVGGSGVSISSYFQKLPSSQTVSHSSQTSNGSGTQSTDKTGNQTDSAESSTGSSPKDGEGLVYCSKSRDQTKDNALQVPSFYPEPASEGRKTKIKHM